MVFYFVSVFFRKGVVMFWMVWKWLLLWMELVSSFRFFFNRVVLCWKFVGLFILEYILKVKLCLLLMLISFINFLCWMLSVFVSVNVWWVSVRFIVIKLLLISLVCCLLLMLFKWVIWLVKVLKIGWMFFMVFLLLFIMIVRVLLAAFCLSPLIGVLIRLSLYLCVCWDNFWYNCGCIVEWMIR